MMKVAIIGCGQLARMMAQASGPLNLELCFVAEAEESTQCVDGFGHIVRLNNNESGNINETAEALFNDLGKPDVITVEREQVDVELLRALEDFCPVHPSPDAVADTQHRLREKNALTAVGIPVAPFVAVNNAEDIADAVATLGYPVFLKSCEQGYDGKNQWQLRNPNDLENTTASFIEQNCVAEAGVDFQFEASLIGARSANGELCFYPMAENRHANGILLSSIAPSEAISNDFQQVAHDYLKRLLEKWNYVGVLAMECFVTESGLIINELAPRVHNSGHWTLTGAITSQFENHLRAVCAMPLGATDSKDYTAMINLLGTIDVPDQASENAACSASMDINLYNKSLRPGRKVGHVNISDNNPLELRQRMQQLIDEIYVNQPDTVAHST